MIKLLKGAKVKTIQLTETKSLEITNRPSLQARTIDGESVGIWHTIDLDPVEEIEVNQGDKGVTISYNGKTVAVEISGLDLTFR